MAEATLMGPTALLHGSWHTSCKRRACLRASLLQSGKPKSMSNPRSDRAHARAHARAYRPGGLSTVSIPWSMHACAHTIQARGPVHH